MSAEVSRQSSWLSLAYISVWLTPRSQVKKVPGNQLPPWQMPASEAALPVLVTDVWSEPQPRSSFFDSDHILPVFMGHGGSPPIYTNTKTQTKLKQNTTETQPTTKTKNPKTTKTKQKNPQRFVNKILSLLGPHLLFSTCLPSEMR